MNALLVAIIAIIILLLFLFLLNKESFVGGGLFVVGAVKDYKTDLAWCFEKCIEEPPWARKTGPTNVRCANYCLDLVSSFHKQKLQPLKIPEQTPEDYAKQICWEDCLRSAPNVSGRKCIEDCKKKRSDGSLPYYPMYP